MPDKMAISAYILKIAGKDPFLRLQMGAKEDFVCVVFPLIVYDYIYNCTCTEDQRHYIKSFNQSYILEENVDVIVLYPLFVFSENVR